MPRNSSHTIVLTRKEREALEKRSREYTMPYRDVVRAKIVLMAADGLQNKKIAERLSLTRAKVSGWQKRFGEERLGGLEDRPRPGRPRSFSPTVVCEVKALACELPAQSGLPLSRFSCAEIRNEVVARGIAGEFSKTTIWCWFERRRTAAVEPA